MQISPSALEPSSGGYRSGRIGPPDEPQQPSAPTGRPRRRRSRIGSLLLLATIVAVAGSAGVLATAKREVGKIQRVDGLSGVFSPSDPNIENFLLVGSDSRAGADPSAPDFGAIGNEGDVSGNRSDTIMVLRRDKTGGPAALLSLPRDLWVDIPGRKKPSRINAAYQDGPATLIQTVQGLGIPIHHYVEVDFQGFKELVDAIGGVEIGFLAPARDEHTGLYVAEPGTHLLDGVQALAYARSRYYENYIDDKWVIDPRSDFGRIERQQYFINAALAGAIAKVKGNPLVAGDVLVSMTGAIRLDAGLDVLGAAGALREAVAGGLQTFTPPVHGKTVNGNAVLLLDDAAATYFAYFSGVSNTPPVPA
ncbi:MAG: LCP family protein [Ilumatobacteraceae bacterium]